MLRTPSLIGENGDVLIRGCKLIGNWLGLGLWYLTPLSTIFQLYRGGEFYWWTKPEDLEKTTDLTNFIT